MEAKEDIGSGKIVRGGIIKARNITVNSKHYGHGELKRRLGRMRFERDYVEDGSAGLIMAALQAFSVRAEQRYSLHGGFEVEAVSPYFRVLGEMGALPFYEIRTTVVHSVTGISLTPGHMTADTSSTFDVVVVVTETVWTGQ